MPSTFYKGTDVHQIIYSLAEEQIQHSFHVKKYVEIMTAKLQSFSPYSALMSEDNLRRYGYATFYHDIGKAWVPQEILSKPDRLTDEEISAIRKHTLFAEELFKLIINGFVSGIPLDLVSLVHDASVYHHEWWNGKGYPYRISQERIPLIARITSICDAYDAITSYRTYKKARDHNYACCEIEANAGIQFDPVLTKVFLDNESTFADFLMN